MANYFRTGTVVTSVQQIIDEILDVVTASGPGAGWVEDATFTAVGNPGKLFLSTSGGTTFYLYFQAATVASKNVLQAFWVPDSGNGFGGGTGPSDHFTSPGALITLQDTTKYETTMHVFNDEDRAVVVLHATLKSGAVPSAFGQDTNIFQILYFGGVAPHAAAVDDPYPLAILGNGGFFPFPAIDDSEEGFFPLALLKRVGPNDLQFGNFSGAGWKPLHSKTFRPPRNSRGAEAFAFQQDVHVFAPGSEESFSLTGLFLSTPDHGVGVDVTIGLDTYFSVPSLVKLTPADIGGSTVGALYLIPKGLIV